MTKAPSARRWLRNAGFVAVTAALGLAGASTGAIAVTGGQTAASSTYPFIATINTAGQACSGVLVHSEWVLTLKSCFGPLTTTLPAPPSSPATATVGSAADVDRIEITEVAQHPWQDVMLAKLKTPVTGVTPVKFGAAPTVGETVTVTGYGRTTSTWAPNGPSYAAVQVGQLKPASFTFSGTGMTLCQGDAGGPTLRQNGSTVEMVGIHQGAGQNGCLGSSATDSSAADIRADILAPWVAQHTVAPALNDPAYTNQARTATTVKASSIPGTTSTYGVDVAGLNDGVRGQLGWSSEVSATDHTEWIKLYFADVRTINRIDIHPRTDVPAAQNNFPSNIRISVTNPPVPRRTATTNGGASVMAILPPTDPFKTIVNRANIPASAGVQQFAFDPRSTQNIRIEGIGVKQMQLAEIEVFYAHPSERIEPDSPLPSIVETGDYPKADEILAQRGIKLVKGDGKIILADCATVTGNHIRLYTFDLTDEVCFSVTAKYGYLKLEMPNVYLIRGSAGHMVTATVNIDGTVSNVDLKTNDWIGVGQGTSQGSATLLEFTAKPL